MSSVHRWRGIPAILFAFALWGQVPPPLPPGFVPPEQQRPAPKPPQAQPQPAPQAPPQAQQQQAPPAAPSPAPPARTEPQTPPAPASPVVAAGGLNLQNASLTEVIDILARQLKLNYILDPRVKGGVFLNTYGELKAVDAMALLEMILRINGAGMVKVGDIWRIVPLSEVARLPLSPEVNRTSVPEDDRTALNLIFLKYAAAEELSKLLEPFLGEFSKMYTYAPANLLLILDSNRSMKRTMELIALFDNEAFTAQRVRLFEVKNSRPTDLAKELDHVFRSVALTEKNTPIKFIGLDRINTIIAVASNPNVFAEVEKWLQKLDIQVKATAGSVDNYIYKVKYQRADVVAMALMQLYGGFGGFGFGFPGMYGGGMYGGMYGGGMYGGGMYGGGMYGGGMYGGGMYGAGMYGGSPASTGATLNIPPALQAAQLNQALAASGAGATPGAAPTSPGGEATGTYLGGSPFGMTPGYRGPRIIPNPMDNSLLIQGTAQEYEGILKVLRELDVPPRQVLIEARIYEVTLTGNFSMGVAAAFQQRGGAAPGGGAGSRSLTASLAGATTSLSVGALVGNSKELLSFLSLAENRTRTKVVSAPVVIATDSQPAQINVGTEVPVLTAQAVTGALQGGSSLFANQVQSRNSGVTLSITPRVSPSGVISLQINQEVSAPIPPAPGGIQSPSFSKRTVQTQVTMEDGDTIAIGGIINENETYSTGGIPVLHRLPLAGYLFGSKSTSKDRTELIVFLSARVIYDTSELAEASEEMKSGLKRLHKIMKERQ